MKGKGWQWGTFGGLRNFQEALQFSRKRIMRIYVTVVAAETEEERALEGRVRRLRVIHSFKKYSFQCQALGI